jgi:hypothetical protein
LPLRYNLYDLTNAGPIWLGSAESMNDVAKQLLKIVTAAARKNLSADGMTAEKLAVEPREGNQCFEPLRKNRESNPWDCDRDTPSQLDFHQGQS